MDETLKYWVGVQWGQSYLMGRMCLFSLCWPPFYIWRLDKNALWSIVTWGKKRTIYANLKMFDGSL